jgi:hypothetical protein
MTKLITGWVFWLWPNKQKSPCAGKGFLSWLTLRFIRMAVGRFFVGNDLKVKVPCFTRKGIVKNVGEA